MFVSLRPGFNVDAKVKDNVGNIFVIKSIISESKGCSVKLQPVVPVGKVDGACETTH